MIEKGTKVRIKDSVIECFLVEFKRRVIGRTGVVVGHLSFRPNDVLVDFPAEGRKKLFKAGAIRESDLEIVAETTEQA